MDAKVLLERVNIVVRQARICRWCYRAEKSLRYIACGLLQDVASYLESQAAVEETPADPQDDGDPNEVVTDPAVLRYWLACRRHDAEAKGQRGLVKIIRGLRRLTFAADPQAEEDRRVGEAFRSAQALPGTYWDMVDGKWCWSPEEPRTSSSVEPEVTADTLVELVCEVRARLRGQEPPARWVETTLHETRTRDGVTTHTTLRESRPAYTGPDTNGCGEASCLSQVRPDVAAALEERFGAEKAAISKTPFEQQLVALGAEIARRRSDDILGYRRLIVAENDECKWIAEDGDAEALAFAAKNRLPAPVAPEVPADVAEDLRKAGAVPKRYEDRGHVWFHVRYANGIGSHVGDELGEWERVIEEARDADSRPSLRDWCEANGGEVAAVLVECRKRGWGLHLSPGECEVRVLIGSALGYGPKALPISAILAACRAAGVTTPWKESTEEQAQEAGEAEEWDVPGTWDGCWRVLSKAGLPIEAVTSSLSHTQALTRWVRDREKEADHAAAS